MRIENIRNLGERIRTNISRVIVGKEDVLDLVLVSLFCSGHVLLEDVPGVGKTVMAKCLAKSIDCDFKRIQFTPDLLPSDLTGIHYYNQKVGEFIFRAGPIFSNIILADEINRATPRTQSSLLECMEERQVTIDGETHQLSRPFFVIATQNPVEIQGTFPLPEAQLDRFFMRIRLGYPTTAEGRAILDRFQQDDPYQSIGPVATGSEIIDAQDSVSQVKISGLLKDYIVEVVESTRKHEKVALGVSPRGSLALMRAAQVLAVFRGRDFVIPDDVKDVAVPVLAHRIILKGHSAMKGNMTSEEVIRDVLNRVTVPVEELEDQR